MVTKRYQGQRVTLLQTAANPARSWSAAERGEENKKRDHLLTCCHVVVVVFFTLTDRASTIPNNTRGCQSGTWSAGQPSSLLFLVRKDFSISPRFSPTNFNRDAASPALLHLVNRCAAMVEFYMFTSSRLPLKRQHKRSFSFPVENPTHESAPC